MKTLNFDKNSWHYKLATELGGYTPPYPRYGSHNNEMAGDSPDICTYTRKIMLGFLILSVIGAVIALVGFLLFQVIFGIIFSIIAHAWIMSDFGNVTLILVGAGGLVTIIAQAISAFSDWRRRVYYAKRDFLSKKIKPDGFIKNAYHSWKEKFCIQIQFSEDNHNNSLRAGE